MFFCTQLNLSASYSLENTRQYKIKLATLQIKVLKYMYHVFENSSDVVSGTKYAGVKIILLINEDYKQVR